jgi:hypothetical protein
MVCCASGGRSLAVRAAVPGFVTAVAPESGAGADWGIIEVNPNASGYGPGNYYGTFNATWDVTTIDQLYSFGYPVAGAFRQARYGGGGLLAYCDVKWGSEFVSSDPTYPNGSDPYGQPYYLVNVTPCIETGGASGGPVFTELNGGWTIIGVNNRGPKIPATDTTTAGPWIATFWLNDYFGAFWRSVVGDVQQGY